MALPARNPFILALYGVSLLGMFGFIAFISQPDGPYIQAVSGYTENSVSSTTASDTTEQVARLNAFSVAGINSSLALDGDPTEQLNKLWYSLAAVDIATEVKAIDPLEVYAVYHSFDATNNSVQVTLGFRVSEHSPLPEARSRITVNSGLYMEAQNSDVLNQWTQPHSGLTLTYKTDFERYSLDPAFNVKQQTSFVGVE